MSVSFGDFSQVLDFTGDDVGEFSGRMGDIFDSVSATDDATRNFTGSLDTLSGSIRNAMGDSANLTESFRVMSDELLTGSFGSYKDGENFTVGYFNGVLSKKGLIWDASRDIGDVSVDALAESIDAYSPSRRTRELAEMWGIGYLEYCLGD